MAAALAHFALAIESAESAENRTTLRRVATGGGAAADPTTPGVPALAPREGRPLNWHLHGQTPTTPRIRSQAD
jgi:hypothetical protein